MNNQLLMEIKELTVSYKTAGITTHAVNGVNLSLHHREVLGIVGETGAGKTTTALAIMRLLPERTGQVDGGSIMFDGQELLDTKEAEMRAIRGKRISMIFQDPMTSLNPVVTVGKQIGEVIKLHNEQGLTKAEVEERVDNMLELVGIPAQRKNEYPHQFSGGMKQRVVIAIALACDPELLIADEPTTALDVTIQAQVLNMMNDLKEKLDMSMILITHDLGVVAATCDNVAIMYAGEVIELGTVEAIFGSQEHHPYTKGLFNSIPDIESDKGRLDPINGMMPDPTNLPEGCKFHPRCPDCKAVCKTTLPPMVEIGPIHKVRCHLFEQGGGGSL